MWLMAQRVDDPDIEAFEVLQAGIRNIVHVWRISYIADAKTQRINVAVVNFERQRG